MYCQRNAVMADRGFKQIQTILSKKTY